MSQKAGHPARSERVTRPNGETIDPLYHPDTGQLRLLTFPDGQLDYEYDPVTRTLASLETEDGSRLDFGYDGALPTRAALSGTVTGATWSVVLGGEVLLGYDNDLRIDAVTVGGLSFGYTYDDDGVLTSAGASDLTRRHGLM